VIPVEEWVLAPGDGALIDRLPNLADRKALLLDRIARLEAREPTVEGPPVPPSSPFHFQPPEPVFLAHAIRSTEPATLANLKAWLWHTGGPLPTSFSPDSLDDTVSQFSTDVKLLTGYFIWASKNGVELDAGAWARRIPLTEFGTDFVLAVAALFLHVRVPASRLPRELARLVHLAVAILGFPEANRPALVQLLRTNRGIAWYLAVNVIRADLPSWSVTPLIAVCVAPDSTAIREALLSGPTEKNQRHFVFELLGTLSQVFCPPDTSPTVLTERFPTAYGVPYQLKALAWEVGIDRPRPVGKEVIEAVLGVLEKEPSVRWEFLYLFEAIEITREATKRVRKLLRIHQERAKLAMRYRLPALFVGNEMTNPRAIEPQLPSFTDRPPSFTRSFFRCLFSQLLRPVPGAIVATITAVLTPVHPALFYSGVMHTGIRVVNALPVSLLRLGGVPGDVTEEIKVCGGDLIPLLEAIAKVNDSTLTTVLPWTAAHGGRDAALATFLYTAVGPGADVQFATAVFEAFVRLFPIEVLLTLICVDTFFSQPNFVCICHIFRLFFGMVKRAGKDDFLEFLELFRCPHRKLFASEFKTAAFSELDRAETIARILHEPE
jgi:hypothetical protein